MKISGFCDLNTSIAPEKFTPKCMDDFISLGYRTIALNTTVKAIPEESTKKKKGQPKGGNLVPLPPQINIPEGLSGKLQVLQRITIYIADANQLQKFCKAENIKKYDLIAVIPTSTSAFQVACACKDIDILSYDASDPPLRLNRKMYNLAVANGLYFEIQYVPAIKDSGMRKNIIQTAHNYHSYGKSKNIVITSGATDITNVRGPYDIANLGLLLGLSEEQSKQSMIHNSRALILHGEGRKYGKTAMTIMITDLGLEESEEESDEEPASKRSKTKDSTDVEML